MDSARRDLPAGAFSCRFESTPIHFRKGPTPRPPIFHQFVGPIFNVGAFPDPIFGHLSNFRGPVVRRAEFSRAERGTKWKLQR